MITFFPVASDTRRPLKSRKRSVISYKAKSQLAIGKELFLIRFPPRAVCDVTDKWGVREAVIKTRFACLDSGGKKANPHVNS
jgi:hypothetical protein